MQTEAVFENIAARIHQEISQAQQSIFLAVAWFTNRRLFNALLSKAREGCTIGLLLSKNDINQNSAIDYEQLNTNGSGVYWIGNSDTELMHNKFCVIDNSTIITGSYNWSYKAESNFENIVVTRDDTTLAKQFIAEFNEIRDKYFPEEGGPEQTLSLDKLIKRLEILKNYILLEDLPEVNEAVSKLKKYQINEDLQQIIDEIEDKTFASAVKKIERLVSNNQKLSVRTDPDVRALQLEIKLLENQLNAFENEKIELEKTLSEFNHRHTIELGDLILEILALRKRKFRSDDQKFEEAQKDEKQYREQVETEKEKDIIELRDEQKAELKDKFRKASILCHPDRVSEEFEETARETFIRLKAAYDANDIGKVSQILTDLEKGQSFKTKSETVSEQDILKARVTKLRNKIEATKNEIISIKQSDAYKTINTIEDWDEYFRTTKKQLQKELEELQSELDLPKG